jgi:hypothetical protein
LQWDIANQAVFRNFKGHTNTIRGIVFGAYGNRIALAHYFRIPAGRSFTPQLPGRDRV